MRCAIIEGSVVENIVLAESDFAAAQGWVGIPEGIDVEIGDNYSLGVFSKTTQEPLKQVPSFIAMWQARDVMIKYGILDDVASFVDSITDPIARKRAQNKFEFSNTVRRDDPLLNFVANQAGYSKDQIDDWFIEGEKL